MLFPSDQNKLQTVIDKNTFYFFNSAFEENYEAHINSIKQTLLSLKNDIKNNGLRKNTFETLLSEKENGLLALLTLTGFSNESLKRLITLIRVVDDQALSLLSLKDTWCNKNDMENLKEWSDSTISNKLRENPNFCRGVVNLFFEGATLPFLVKTIPLFELKKLNIAKLEFNLHEMLDTLIRYKEKGSYSGKKDNNPEKIIENILNKLGITYEQGDLTELISNAPIQKRTMDFIIPNKQSPILVIESSFLVTTSSGQGDKSKTEVSIQQLISEHYPKAKFIGFIDGIGWYVRKGDLKRMVTAYEDVFTFHKDELIRFENLLREEFKQHV